MAGLNNEEYQVVIGNDTTSYIIDDLESARNYSFYIVAYMPMGASRMSDQVTQHTLEDGENRECCIFKPKYAYVYLSHIMTFIFGHCATPSPPQFP